LEVLLHARQLVARRNSSRRLPAPTDIGGIAVHIGARVSALAGPNDVLVSSTLRDLVIGSGLEFEERGAHALKGVPGEWQIFAVAS
jgi:class 3 adenylate cyclase